MTHDDMTAGAELRRDLTPTLLIGGEPEMGEGRAAPLLDRYTGAPIADLVAATPAQAARMVDAAWAAFRRGAPGPWDRGAILDRAALQVEAARGDFIAIMQAEAGFTAADAGGEVTRCVQTLRLSAEEARRLSGDVIPLEGAPGQAGRTAFTLRVPLGPVLAITPFNSPLNTVCHKIAPAFAAGNPAILKPASATPATACLLARILVGAGLPEGFLSVLLGGPAEAGLAMADPRVRFIAFTGSTEAGRAIQTQAGLRRTQMELGSIAFTILAADADLDRALPKIVGAGYRKAGQVCTSVQIVLAHESLRAEAAARLAELVAALPYGDPRAEGTVTGPMISRPEAERVERWIAEAEAAGAVRLAGGGREGAVVAPTLLDGITPAMKAGCEELFGPVVGVAPFATLDEAIARVNATPYGLATGAFTNRLDDAFALARRLEVGGVHINETSSSRVDLMPYGGSKDSGFGREGPHYAVREMTEERILTLTA
ncbi:aldehyde dehydrogenase family protein [Albimonas pacifica]|uniref:Succinate-semialdehyde dehydrogenase / glutarate-semialdehyde dehydrogenase n=1 Tax=Albimonas pacifica TaxID=1114924 RepID=A0A1I3FTF2_9RHOB|nr:aldehyde dehydrogenase family protein [Albimonas pacifica]SFI14211.1 succinate-semialdehyde dehydrogenase / glutarate-semialdehyde dehydrogenase [Albimonas pacifica]